VIAGDVPVVVRSCGDCPWWQSRWAASAGRCGATGADTSTHDLVTTLGVRSQVRVLTGCPLLTGPILVRLA
jgi:hypothetical protein